MESSLHITLQAQRLFEVWGVPITNTVVATWGIMAAMLIAAAVIGSRLKLVPGRVQNAVEMGIELVWSYVSDMLPEKYAKRYFPLIATIFIFVLVANMIEFAPIYETVTAGHTPLFHVATTDLNTPLALAIISFFVAEFAGIGALGVLKYGSKFVNFRGGAMGFIIGILEIIGDLARLISLSFRLFGAIFAGEVLVMVISYFVPYLAPVPLMAFEMFIGLLQAAIFAILTLAYIKLAVEEPHGAGAGQPHTASLGEARAAPARTAGVLSGGH